MKDRKSDIFDFCYDLGLMWSRHPDLRFGDLITILVSKNMNIAYMLDAECLDYIRETLEGLNG